MVKCPHCGVYRPWIAYGVSHQVLGDCPNGCMESERQRRIAESASAPMRIQDRQATCLHEWRSRVQSGYGYEYCAKCGDTRPVGGGSW